MGTAVLAPDRDGGQHMRSLLLAWTACLFFQQDAKRKTVRFLVEVIASLSTGWTGSPHFCLLYADRSWQMLLGPMERQGRAVTPIRSMTLETLLGRKR